MSIAYTGYAFELSKIYSLRKKARDALYEFKSKKLAGKINELFDIINHP